MLPGIAGMMTGLNQIATASYVGSSGIASFTDDRTTLSSVSLGSGSFKLLNIHWTYLGSSADELASVTVGGNAATILVQDSHSGGGTGLGAGIAIIETSSSSADILLIFNTEEVFSGVRVDVFAVDGIQNTTPFDVEEVRGFNDTSVTDLINVPNNGFLLLCATGSTNTDPYGMAFTGATEVYDGSASFTGRYGGALYSATVAETNRTIGLTMTDGSGDVDDSGVELVAVSFGP